MAFASGGTVRLVDDAPPQPLALSDDGALEGQGGVLELQDEATDGTGDVSVWADPAGGWWLEDAHGQRPVLDGESVEVGHRRWTLSLPELTSVQPTARDTSTNEPPPKIALRTGLFDPTGRALRRGDEVISLSPTEAKLLSFLAERPGVAVSHRELLSRVWGYHQAVESRTVYVTVNRLRHKIERQPTEPEHLLSVPGLGYRFQPL